MKIKSNKFYVAINDVLSGYALAVNEGVASAVNQTAKKSLAVVRQKSPVRFGDYKKGWASTTTKNSVIIHNKKQYRLTHLLEHGHQLPQGGRAKAYPHIRPAEQEAERILPQLVKQAIEEIGE